MKEMYYFVFLMLLSACSVEANAKEKVSLDDVPMSFSIQDDFDSTRLDSVLNAHVDRIRSFAQKKGSQYSTNKAILVDMKIPSNYFRLFVVDLNTRKILAKGMCAHGQGSEIYGTDSLQFSNVPNSYMTSLGMYKIGKSYVGSFGKSYKLYGLESTNSKAYDRVIVLHSYSCVPDDEQKETICNSLGCIMVSENFKNELIPYIEGESKALLMDVYY